MGRSLAAYHLDRIVDDGLLEVSSARRRGRTGPGAGRRAKLDARSSRQFQVSLPARDYELVARLLAEAVQADPSSGARVALEESARQARVANSRPIERAWTVPAYGGNAVVSSRDARRVG